MMMKKKNLQILLICGVLLVTACKSKSKEEQQSGYRMEGDTVQITDRFLFLSSITGKQQKSKQFLSIICLLFSHNGICPLYIQTGNPLIIIRNQ